MEKIKFISYEDKRLKIFGMEVFYLWILGIIFAFVGWFGENMFKLFTDGFIDSRFHLLPFIGAYALVPFAVHIALGDADHLRLFGWEAFKKDTLATKIWSNIICFLLICLTVFLGELAIGNMWEYFFNVKLWDYSNMWGHLTQYTCVFATFLYGTLAYICFRFVFKPLLKLFQKKIPYKVAMIICLTLGILLIVDELRMMITIMVTNEAPQFWKWIIIPSLVQ